MSKKIEKIKKLKAELETITRERDALKKQVQSLNNLITKEKELTWKKKQNLAVRQFLRRFENIHHKKPHYFMLDSTDYIGYWFKYKVNEGSLEDKWCVAHGTLTMSVTTPKS